MTTCRVSKVVKKLRDVIYERPSEEREWDQYQILEIIRKTVLLNSKRFCFFKQRSILV